MTQFSSSLRQLIGISKDEGSQFCKKHNIKKTINAERLRGLDSLGNEDIINSVSAFQEEFGVNLRLLHTALSKGHSVKQLLIHQENNPSWSLNDILQELVDGTPEPEPVYSFGGEEVSFSTIMSILDIGQFSPLRAAALTYEEYQVEPDAELAIHSSRTPLPIFLEKSMPGISEGILTISAIPEGSDQLDGVIQSAFLIDSDVGDSDTVVFSNAMLATVLACPEAGAIPMSLVLRGIDHSRPVKTWDPESGQEKEGPRSIVAGWLYDGDEWKGLSAADIASAFTTDHETGSMIVPDEDVYYGDALDIDPYLLEEAEE